MCGTQAVSAFQTTSKRKPDSFGTAKYTYIYANPESYEPLVQVHDWSTEDGESWQQTRYFHYDQIGIPREMTDKDGNLLWFDNYTGWGRLKEETKVTDSAYQPFRLQNQYADRETGLHYDFFRYYGTDAGRFVNQDPIGVWGDNLYQFGPNIQSWADFLGLSSTPVTITLQFVTGMSRREFQRKAEALKNSVMQEN